jgi:hypothetical protein
MRFSPALTAQSTSNVLPFRVRSPGVIRRCADCGSHFEPMGAHHALCRRCWGWARAGSFLAAACRALSDAEARP